MHSNVKSQPEICMEETLPDIAMIMRMPFHSFGKVPEVKTDTLKIS